MENPLSRKMRKNPSGRILRGLKYIGKEYGKGIKEFSPETSKWIKAFVCWQK